MNEINISRLVDGARLRRYHVWLGFWCLLAMMADGFDLLNASIAGPALIKEWGVSRAALGPVFSASLLGYFIGAPIFGFVGDRYGRRLAIIVSLILVGVTTLACAWAHNVPELIWLRLASGLGLGGVLPNVIALNAEFSPKRIRATMMVVMAMGISLGGAIPGIVGATLMPSYGWPIIFVVGGVAPLVVGLCLIFVIPDSIKFMVLRGGRDAEVARLARHIAPDVPIPENAHFVLDHEEGSAATRGSPLALFRQGWAPVTIAVWLMFVINLMANNVMNGWLPMIMQIAGHTPEQGAWAGTIYQLGGSAGGLAIGVLIDRVGLRVLLPLFLIACPIVVLTGLPGMTLTTQLVMCFFMGCAITGMQNGINAGSGLIYPTALRANGVGYALGIGRVGSVLGPLIGSLLTEMQVSSSEYFYVTAFGPLLCAGAALMLLRRLRQVGQETTATAASRA